MISTILTALGPIIAMVIKSFIKDKAKAEELIKSYYSFLDANDKAIETKVSNSVKLRKARREKQLQLLKEKAERDKNKEKK